jgi:hypothetical protein
MEKGYNIILKKLNIIVSYLIIRVVDWFGKINLFFGGVLYKARVTY